MPDYDHHEQLSPDEQIAQGCRVMHALGLTDLRGSLSGRAPGAGFALGPTNGLGTDAATGRDVSRFDTGAGSGSPEPAERAEAMLHAAIYGHRPDVGGIAHTCQPYAMAFGLAGAPLLPITHQEADLAWAPIPVWGTGDIPRTAAERTDFLQCLGQQNVIHLPGEGVIVVASSPRGAVVRAHYLEWLARNTHLGRSLAQVIPGGLGAMALIPRAETEQALAERPDWDHFWHFYGAIDPRQRAAHAPTPPADARTTNTLPPGNASAPSDTESDWLRQKLALACRILYRYGLCSYLEHCSIRIPGQDAFWINPLGDLSSMTAADLATVDLDSNWIAGPRRPPGHKWLHARIFRDRPDVLAIVHTHQPLSRVFAIAGVDIPPVIVPGAEWVQRPQPIWPSPALIFDVQRAQSVLTAMGGENVVHGRGHGIEYVSDNIEDATFAALASERQAQLALLAAQLAGGLDKVPRLATSQPAPPATAWWQYFVRQLSGPPPAWAAPYPLHW